MEMIRFPSDGRKSRFSLLNILDTWTGRVRLLRRFEGVAEAPNWLSKTDRLLFNAGGRIYTIDLHTARVAPVDTGACLGCNNDHVVSPGERLLAVSDSGVADGVFTSRIYILPLEGGEPRLVTPDSPSFLHGWSPDGEELCYCAFREHDGRLETDVYVIPAAGGRERRLTFGGFNDGPEYSPDGRYIWFNSTRSGPMQLWRMGRDGSDPRQMTFSRRNNWFGHVSPDGRQVAYISYREGDLAPNEHLPDKEVELRLMDADGGNDRAVLTLFGGQGSMNVNSWCADSRRLAFMSYEL